MTLHLISFGSPKATYNQTMNRFHSEASALNLFGSIEIFSELDCFDYAKELFYHRSFMESSRAYGFWIWKIFLISDFMKVIPENSVLCYADVGCTFNSNGKARLQEYYSMAIDKGSLCFDIFHLEREFTKRDTYARVFPEDESYFHTGQRCATTFFLKNTKENRLIVDEIKVISVENNYHHIDDSPSILPNHETFKGEHRYDQSIFSLISKKYNFHCIPDETYWCPNWMRDGKDYPIWATRLR